uniref:Putative hexaprenyl pyrophosphate synthetase, mitochondrial n=1 Tax=Aegilops tauschii TaxID=37682 RepID=M8BQ49_AEGTA
MSWRWALARRVATLVGGGTGGGPAPPQAQRLFSSSGALLGRLPPAPPQIRNKVPLLRALASRPSPGRSSHALFGPWFAVLRPWPWPFQEQQDPFELVADELSILGNRLRSMVVAEVLLLMASALKFPIPESTDVGVFSILASKLRTRQQNIAEITEMIHVASLLHDDVLDDADTRRGVTSLNCIMGNKLSVLAGDFLLSRACVALAALGNTEVVSLMATAVGHLVTGETMQMSTSREQRRSMEYYLQKTYYKTASLISNSCKAVAILAGHTAEVSVLAYEYGRNLGLAFQLIDDVLDFTGTSASLGKGSLSDIRHGIITAPMLYAMEEFPQLQDVVDQGFDNPANVEIALDYLQKSRGIERTKELAQEHVNLAVKAIEALPDSDDEDVLISRRALIDITQRVITRTK